MAHPTITHPFLPAFLILLLCAPPLLPARTLTDNLNPTTSLDVSASIHRARTVFSLTPHSVDEFNLLGVQEQSLQPPSSSLTLQVHSRSSIVKPSESDYRSLVLSRLERDSARVRSLETRLELAVKRVSKSDLKPEQIGEVFEPEAVIQGPIISGTSLGSGEYFSRVGIGSPPKQFYMVLDTGSDVTWKLTQLFV
uniref:Peptidase A1 domain-containing protein n=1 Tax=Kalanchoe fedtschenkoi TaxID=63787 RepID=A0A7N0U1M6_KALFE